MYFSLAGRRYLSHALRVMSEIQSLYYDPKSTALAVTSSSKCMTDFSYCDALLSNLSSTISNQDTVLIDQRHHSICCPYFKSNLVMKLFLNLAQTERPGR